MRNEKWNLFVGRSIVALDGYTAMVDLHLAERFTLGTTQHPAFRLPGGVSAKKIGLVVENPLVCEIIRTVTNGRRRSRWLARLRCPDGRPDVFWELCLVDAALFMSQGRHPIVLPDAIKEHVEKHYGPGGDGGPMAGLLKLNRPQHRIMNALAGRALKLNQLQRRSGSGKTDTNIRVQLRLLVAEGRVLKGENGLFFRPDMPPPKRVK